MDTPECFYRVSIKAYITNAGWRFLLCKESSWDRELPGGWRDHGESYEECLSRELYEEMGLAFERCEDKPSYVIDFISPNSKTPRINLIYQTRVKDYNFTPSDECVELWFFTPAEALQLSLLPSVRKFATLLVEKERNNLA